MALTNETAPARSSTRWLVTLVVAVALIGGGGIWFQTTRGQRNTPGTYVALGASDAVGIGADRPNEAWVPRVHALLPAGTQLINLGISGGTLQTVLDAEMPPALDAHPRWVTLWPGVNDIRAGVALPTFAEQLDRILGQFNSGTAPDRTTVIVLTIPDLRTVPVFHTIDAAKLAATVRDWNNTIADAAHRHGALLVDLAPLGPEIAAHPEYISGDGFHPSSAGYARIAELVGTVLGTQVAAHVS